MSHAYLLIISRFLRSIIELDSQYMSTSTCTAHVFIVCVVLLILSVSKSSMCNLTLPVVKVWDMMLCVHVAHMFLLCKLDLTLFALACRRPLVPVWDDRRMLTSLKSGDN